MKKTFVTFLFISFCTASFSQLSNLRYFVRFTDKNSSPYSIATPSDYLSSRAIQRRTNQNIVIDSLDLPVNPQYVDSLIAHGATAYNRSKWFNGVTISVPDSATLNAVMSLPFVQSTSHVWRKRNGIRKNKFEMPADRSTLPGLAAQR